MVINYHLVQVQVIISLSLVMISWNGQPNELLKLYSIWCHTVSQILVIYLCKQVGHYCICFSSRVSSYLIKHFIHLHFTAYWLLTLLTCLALQVQSPNDYDWDPTWLVTLNLQVHNLCVVIHQSIGYVTSWVPVISWG